MPPSRRARPETLRPGLTRWTSIARPVDPAWPTNRAIAVLAGLVVAGTAVVELLAGRGGVGLGAALAGGLVAGLSVFLAWALARELDPDREWAAFTAAILGLACVLWLGVPRFGSLFLLLLALRIVNRTVGPPARAGDTLAILALAAWTAWSGDWIAPFALLVAFVLDGTLEPAHRLHLPAAGAALALAGVAADRAGFPPDPRPATALSVGALLLLLPYLRVLRRSAALEAVADADARPLDPRRVRAAQALGLLAAALAIAVEGRVGLAGLAPLWAGLVGCGLHGLAGSWRRPG